MIRSRRALPARGQGQRGERGEGGHELAVRGEALDHGRRREQAAEQGGGGARAATGQARDQQPQDTAIAHDQSAAMRRMSNLSEPGSASAQR